MTLPSQRKSARLEIDATHTKRRTIRAIDDQSVVDELRQKGGGKSERETRTSVGELMGGGATTKCGDSIDEVIDLQSPVAAAASTVLYSLQYGDSGGYGDDSAHSIESPSGEADCDEDDDYILGGLIFSDDEDFLVDVDSESEDERLRSSFPKDRTRKTIIPGGPQPPDLSNYPESEHSSVWGKYVKARKKFVDDERHKRLKTQKSMTNEGNRLSGDQTEQLRPMAEVEKSRLIVGNVFRSKDVVKLRIAEEANLRGISTRAQRSDVMNLTVVGINFYVHATVYENVGWCIHAAVCRECDDVLKIPPRDRVDLSVIVEKKGYVRIPIKAKMIVPIIREAVADNPGISYQSIREIMKPYAKAFTLTDSIIQDGKDLAKLDLFGNADDNVKYAKGVKDHLTALGHAVELRYHDRRRSLQLLTSVVINDEQVRRKKMNLPALDKQLQLNFVRAWKTQNARWINTVFGLEDGPQFEFLSGALFATESSRHIVPRLQHVVQADGAHSSFGKYTLFSAYASTANGNMSPLAFGLLFGNEDTKNWAIFWNFVLRVHPSLNSPEITILTDQDKGSIAAVAQEIPSAAQFHCSFHRRQNIIKNLGGGKGVTPNTPLWVYNLLCGCHSVAQLEAAKAKHYPNMHPTSLRYLMKLTDECQYPAARCAMAENICMYSKSASSGVESMNRANTIARQRTAVDVLNAMILLIKLEGSRFEFYKQKAWSREEILTNRGMELMEEAFKDVNPREYQLNITDSDTFHRITVTRMTSTNEYTVIIPVDEFKGTRFGSCTCGKPNTDGIPCKHMVVVAMSSKIKGLTRMHVMPYWWTTQHWQDQYAMEVNCRTDISLNTVKSNTRANDTLRYVPAWLAPKKKGRPNRNVREKSVMDLIEESAKKKKRTRRIKLYCRICHKHNHNTVDCYQNPANEENDQAKQQKTLENVMEESDKDGEDGKA